MPRQARSVWITGSSPRERGTRRARTPGSPTFRFIPARAGNATAPRWSYSPGSVHPRASGERCPGHEQSRCAIGSSPRERGTPEPCRLRRGMGRFIPARAGNATQAEDVITGTLVHPRASGERCWSVMANRYAAGSSPRERGTHDGPQTDALDDRFIPARAGNASSTSAAPARTPVHPRASGERETGC